MAWATDNAATRKFWFSAYEREVQVEEAGYPVLYKPVSPGLLGSTLRALLFARPHSLSTLAAQA
ncbi:MAG: hypothetical protein ABI574_12135 [Burkholderiales bacterium]